VTLPTSIDLRPAPPPRVTPPPPPRIRAYHRPVNSTEFFDDFLEGIGTSLAAFRVQFGLPGFFSEYVVLIENSPPVPDACGPYTVARGSDLTLDGSAWEPDADFGDSVVSYEWDLDGDGAFDDATGATVVVDGATLSALLPMPGTYTLALRATDTRGASATATAELTLRASGDIALSASVEDGGSPVATVKVGDEFEYVVGVQNLGPDAVTDVSVSDGFWDTVEILSLPAGCTLSAPFNAVNCSTGPIAVGETLELRIGARAIDGGDAGFSPSASSVFGALDPDSGNNGASASLTIDPLIADLALSALATGAGGPLSTAKVGTEFDWVITVRNDGPDDASRASLSGGFPATLEGLSITSGCTLSVISVNGRGAFSCQLGPIAAGQSKTVTISVLPIDDGDGTLLGTLSSGNGSLALGALDPDSSDNSLNVPLAIDPLLADKEIGLAVLSGGAAIDTAQPGDEFEWVITVQNHGPDEAARASLTGGFPDTLEGLSITPGCSLSVIAVNGRGALACELGPIAPGESKTVTVQIRAVADGDGTMSATVSGGGGSLASGALDPDGSNNSRNAPFTVITNRPPVADAGGPYGVDEGGTVALDASGSSDPDPDDTLTYEWDLDGDGEFDDAAGPSPTFSAAALDGPASPAVQVRVCDQLAACDTASAVVTVTNVAPTVTLTADVSSAVRGQVVTLTGSFTDPAGAADEPYSYEFSTGGMVFAPNAVLGGGQVHGTVSFSTLGLHEVTLAVVDDDGAAGSATVSIEVVSQTPVASAGDDQVVDEGGSVGSDGSASHDPDRADTITIEWDLDGDGVFGDASGATPAFSAASLDGPGVVTVAVGGPALRHCRSQARRAPRLAVNAGILRACACPGARPLDVRGRACLTSL
jgi:hypothetical protein